MIVVGWLSSAGPEGVCAPARGKRIGTFSGKSKTGVHWTARAAEYLRTLALSYSSFPCPGALAFQSCDHLVWDGSGRLAAAARRHCP
eukprot:5860568-Pyramimonas_sp.AAC.1